MSAGVLVITDGRSPTSLSMSASSDKAGRDAQAGICFSWTTRRRSQLFWCEESLAISFRWFTPVQGQIDIFGPLTDLESNRQLVVAGLTQEQLYGISIVLRNDERRLANHLAVFENLSCTIWDIHRYPFYISWRRRIRYGTRCWARAGGGGGRDSLRPISSRRAARGADQKEQFGDQQQPLVSLNERLVAHRWFAPIRSANRQRQLIEICDECVHGRGAVSWVSREPAQASFARGSTATLWLEHSWWRNARPSTYWKKAPSWVAPSNGSDAVSISYASTPKAGIAGGVGRLSSGLLRRVS